MALSRGHSQQDWLLWTDSSGTLSGFHLPDMVKVGIDGVLSSGVQDVELEVSGDLAVLMVVASAGDPRYISPNFTPPPKWTAIRVVRLR